MDRLSEEEIIDKVMMIDQWKVSGDIYTQNELNAIGELLDLYNKEKEKNKKLQDDNIKYKNANDYLSSLNHKYYEDNVLLLRKNGHIDILKDNIHFKYIDDTKNYISKDKIREKIYPTPENPIELEIQNSKMYKDLRELLEEGN